MVPATYFVGARGETGAPLEPDLYRVIPDLEAETGKKPEDTIYGLSLSPARANLHRHPWRGPGAFRY
jgi:hypothetical protein